MIKLDMKAIINFATGHYMKGQERLRQSLVDQGFDGLFMGFNHESQIGSPQHELNPYAFKVYAFEKVLSMGYKKILWVDASVWAVKPLDPIWASLEEKGYMKEYAGHLVGTWANDATLNYFGVTRDEAMKMEMHANGGFFALDFDTDIAKEFFEKWKASMMAGMFKGAWANANNSESTDPRCQGHRHDMTCGSIIANQLGMKAYNRDTLMAYVGEPYGPAPETAVMYAQGM